MTKSLSFTEKPLAITETLETEVVMDFLTTQIKQDGTESTVEIMVHSNEKKKQIVLFLEISLNIFSPFVFVGAGGSDKNCTW